MDSDIELSILCIILLQSINSNSFRQSVKYLTDNNIILDSFRYPNTAKESLLQFTGVGPKVYLFF